MSALATRAEAAMERIDGANEHMEMKRPGIATERKEGKDERASCSVSRRN